MFCKNCGKEIAENSAFCVNCGAQLTTAPVQETVATQPVAQATAEVPVQQPVAPAAPAAPVAPSPFATLITETIQLFKGMLSNNGIKTVTDVAQSKKLTWLVVLVFNFIVQIFSNIITVFTSDTLSSLNSLSSMFSRSGTSGPLFVGMTIGSIVLTSILFFGISGAIWVLMNMVFKKTTNFTCILNVVATCAIPLVAANTVNIIVNIIFAPIAIALTVAGIIAFFITLYVGIQKLNKLDKSLYLAYLIMIAIITFVFALVGWIVVQVVISSALSSMTSSLGAFSSLF